MAGLLGRPHHLAAVPDPEPSREPVGGGLDGGTGPERQAIHDYLLGTAIEAHVRQAVELHGGGPGTPAQRAALYREARELVLDAATTPEHISEAVDRARAVGRGEVTSS